MAKIYGLNVAINTNYESSNIVFADLMFQSSSWSGYGSHTDPGSTSDGWPNYIDSTTGSTQCIVALNSYLPAGDYTLYPTGVGSVSFTGGFAGSNSGGGKVVTFDGSNTPVTVTLPTTGFLPQSQITFQMISSQQGNPLRVKFMLPGHDATRIVNQAWIDSLKADATHHVGVIRFMDAQRTNASAGGANNAETTDPYSRIDDWTNPYRSGPGRSLKLKNRMPEEYVVGIINEIKQYGGIDVDPWICQPVYATATGANNWQQGFRDICQDGCTIDGHTIAPLNANSRVIWEYSNENWNTGFGQYSQHYQLWSVKEASQVAAYQAAHPEYGTFGIYKYIGHRASYMGRKFKDKFAGDSRTVIRAWCSQGAYYDRGRIELEAYEAPNLYDGQTATPDMIGAGIYVDPESAPGTNLDYKTLSDSYATDPAGTLNTFFAAFPQFFVDLLPPLQQYMQMAATRHVPFCLYEFGLNPNNFNTSLTTHPNISTMLDAAYEDARIGPSGMKPIADALPDGSIACQYFDTGWGFGFRWGLDRVTGQSPPSARRTYFNSMLMNEASSGGGGRSPSHRAARRFPALRHILPR